jgi:hypothetical protein
MEKLGDSPRHVAAQIALQLYGNVDPDTSKYLADHVVFAVDRTAFRGSYTGGPTHDEVNRLMSALDRRGIGIERDDAYAALLAVLCPGLVKEGQIVRAPDAACDFCRGGAVANAGAWIGETTRPIARCPHCDGAALVGAVA